MAMMSHHSDDRLSVDSARLGHAPFSGQQQHKQYPEPPHAAQSTSQHESTLPRSQTSDESPVMTRPRSQSHTVYSTYVPPPLSASSSRPSSFTGGVSSAPSNSGPVHESAGDNPARFQNWRTPAHKSKLSMQYTPSEESDDESPKADIRRRSRFLSGAPLELNRDGGENMRALSNLCISDGPTRSATPSLTDSIDSASIKSASKKLSLGKRISKFFTGGSNSGSSGSSSNTKSSKSSSSSLSPNTPSIGKDSQHGHYQNGPSDSTSSLHTIDEVMAPPRAHGIYLHQRSHSTPDQIGSSNDSLNSIQNVKMEENRLRKARDSGFEEVDGKGHRRYSSSNSIPRVSTGSTPSSPSLHPQKYAQHNSSHTPTSHANRQSVIRSEPMYIEQSSHHPHLQHGHHPSSDFKRSTQGNAMLSSSTPQLRVLPERESQNQRHSYVGPELAYHNNSPLNPPVIPHTPRRSSTPSVMIEPLISRVDREKSTVCFQTPNVRKDAFQRDTHLDPALASLVEQHRRDFRTNHRLGGTPEPHQQPPKGLPHQFSPQLLGASPRMRASTYMDESHIPPMMMAARDPTVRRDSSGSQHLFLPHPSSPGLLPHSTSPSLLPHSTSPGLLPRPSSPGFMPHPSSPGLHAIDIQNKRLSTSSQHLPQFTPPHQRISPKRQLSAGYFPEQLQQQYQQSFMSASPYSSPSLGPVGSFSEASVQQQQQLEQLQQIRLQQQHLLLQQQQHLHQQLQQTRAAVTATGTTVVAVPVQNTLTAVSPLYLAPTLNLPPPQQQLQQIPIVAYTTPVAATQRASVLVYPATLTGHP